jgi:Na+/H+ antiporter NhaD/arsenite permease-like protein
MHTELITTTDAVSQSIVALAIVGLFVILTLEAAHRVLVVLGAAALLWFFTYLTPYHLIPFEAAWRLIDINVLLLLGAMMAIVGVLRDTGVFAWAVAKLMRATGGRPFLLLTVVIWFTAILSAMLDNVTTVIFVTPMVLAASKQLKIPAAAFLLPVVMASNVGGTATLIGDPPNIMIASGVHISFGAFLVNVTAPVLVMVFLLDWFAGRYYATELGGSAGAGAVMGEVPPVTNPRLLRWSAVILAGVFAGFLTQSLTGMPPAVPAVMGAAAMMAVQDVFYMRQHKPTARERQHGILRIFEHDIEWPTLAFFAFLFIVVGAAVETGLIASVARGLSEAIHSGSSALGLGDAGTLLLAAVLICWVSGFLSAFIDNIPYVAVSIPIVQQLAGELHGDTMVLWWALSLGACLGGNGTAVGASANVTVTGMAEKAGHAITFRSFARFGAPFATLTIVISSAYLALFVFAGARPAYWVFLGLAVVMAAVKTVRRPRPA